MSKGLLPIIFGAMFVLSCAPKAEPPAISTRVKTLNVEACQNTSLDLRLMTPPKFRGLIKCLSGDNHSLQPYEDLLGSIEDKDLAVLLSLHNDFLFKDPVHANKLLKVLDLMHAKGTMHELMGAIQVLAEAGVLERALPLFQKTLEASSFSENIDPVFLKALDLWPGLAKGNAIAPALVFAGRLSGGANAKVMAKLTSLSGVKNVLTRPEIVDRMATEVTNLIDDGTLHDLLTNLNDPQLQPTLGLQTLSPSEREDLASFIAAIVNGPQGRQRFEKFQLLSRGSDQPLNCFLSKSGKSLRAQNLRDVIALESAKRAPGKETEVFFVRTLPLLLATTQDSCNYSPLVTNNISVLQEMAAQGYANGKRSFFKYLIATGREEKIARAVESPHLTSMSDLFDELGVRDQWPFAINILAQDITADDAKNFSESLEYVTAAGSQWRDSSEGAIYKLVKKILAPDQTRRFELQALVEALSKSLQNDRGGLGDVLHAFGEASILSKDTPIQDLFTEVISNKDYLNKLLPIILKLSRNSHMPEVLEFTGQLAGSGELEHLVQFFADMGQSAKPAPLSPPPNEAPFVRITQLQANHVLTAHVNSPLHPFEAPYSPCLNVRGSLFASDGEALSQALKCAGAEDSDIRRIQNDLNKSGVIGAVADVLGQVVKDTSHVADALGELDQVFRSGDLAKILNLISRGLGAPYSLGLGLDPILADAFRHKGMPQTLDFVGRIVSTEDVAKASRVLLDISSGDVSKPFKSHTNYRLRVQEPEKIKEFIRQWYPQASEQEVARIYDVARENFETHNWAWRGEGSYPLYNDAQWKAEIIGFIEDLLRSDDLAQFVLSMQDIGHNLQPIEFLKSATTAQRVVLQYKEDGSRVVHILTQFDQLEELVEDADFVFNPLGHAGVNFQLTVAHSKDLVSDMKNQKRLVETGITLAPHFGKHHEYIKMLNMISNYDGLMQIAQNGHLRIFQRIYQGLYHATPWVYRELRDVRVNHMATLFKINNLGVFQAITMAMNSLQDQGQLENAVHGFFSALDLIKPEDIEPLRETLLAAVENAKQSNVSPLNVLLDKILERQKDVGPYQNMKEGLFNVFSAMGRLGVRLTGVLRAFPALISQPKAWNDAIDEFFDQSTKAQGLVPRISTNLLTLPDSDLEPLRHLLTVAFSENSISAGNNLPAMMALGSDVYALHAKEISDYYQRFHAFKDDPQVKALNSEQILRNLLNQFESKGTGLGDQLGAVLGRDDIRLSIVKLGYLMAHQGDFEALSRVLQRQIQNGGVDNALHFIFDNLRPSSLGLINQQGAAANYEKHH